MKLQPIKLSVKRTIWSTDGFKDHVHSSDPDASRKAILERDKHTCQFCGFQSQKYQLIHHINGFKDDFSDKNCLTACIFCHQCFDLKSVAEMGSGMLIWLPELGQAVLHHIMRAIYVGRITQGPVGDSARQAFELLTDRREEARKRLGTDNPEALAMVMEDFMSHKMYENSHKQLEGIRLLPLDKRMINDEELKNYNQFPQILAYWRSKNGPFADLAADKWLSELGPVLKNAA